MVTEESIRQDLTALPPNIAADNKYYIGYYEADRLLAVMDLITGYPEKQIAYIGFFMTNIEFQKKGIGSEIISELCEYLKSEQFIRVRLAWAKGNPQAEHFWIKNKFVILKETSSSACKSVILAEKIIE